MAEDLNKDYSSIYDIKKFFISDIGPRYFDVEDLSLANVGLFGMTNDILGSLSEDTFNTVSRYITEMIPSKARLPEYIYANAAMYGISDVFTTCAHMPIYLYIKESDIINYGKVIDGRITFVIDSDMSVILEGIPYTIPHNIVITASMYKDSYNYQCMYDQLYTNDVVKLNSPFIKHAKSKIGNDIYITMKLDVYQYKKVKSHENIISNNKINIPFIDVNFSGNICNFEILYKPPSLNKTIQLRKLLDCEPAIKDPFIYYKLIDDNTIRFSFSNDDRYFTPEYNSDLYIELFETIGDKGSFQMYTGSDYYVKASSENEEYFYNNDINMFCLIRGDSIDGRAKLALEELRRLTLERMVTVSSYTTDNDLNTYFLNYTKLYGTEALFIKNRDDYYNRLYGCYTILKDNVNILPTNTLNLNISPDETDRTFESIMKYIIKPGTKFHYINDDTLTDCSISGEDTVFSYCSPALISISKNPNSVAFYINSIDKNIITEYKYMNLDSMYQFVISDMYIKRNAIIGDESYKITLNIASSSMISSDLNKDLDMNKIKILLQFKDSDTYIEFDYIETIDETIFSFQCEIMTDDMISDNRISVTNLKNAEDGSIQNKLTNMENPDVNILIFYKYDTVEDHDYKDYSIVSDYTLVNIYTPEENSLYLAYCLNLMSSTLKFIDDPTNEYNFSMQLMKVPLISSDYLMSEDRLKRTLELIKTQHDFLLDVSLRHTSNYSIDIKFYNTYGRSRFFCIDNDESMLLNRVNCNIRLKIKFMENTIIDDFIPEIKAYVKTFIESINSVLNTGNNELYMSLLTTNLHNKFTVIKFVIVDNINGYSTQELQCIEMIDVPENQKSKLIPEFLTISEDNIIIETITK